MKYLKLLSLTAATAIVLLGSQAHAAGDAEKGKKVAKKCKACHSLKKGGRNKLGPALYGILGQKAGGVKGYKYSKALMKADLTWDENTFNDFITKPRKIVKGTKMSFSGVKKAAQRADLLAYFKTLGSNDGKANAVMGNVDDGKKVAAKHCAVCHSFDKGGKVVYGPNLWDIAGKPAAAIKGYRYSKALKNSNLVWSEKNLIAFMSNPEQFVKGTTARFPGLKTAKDKADIVVYIKTLK